MSNQSPPSRTELAKLCPFCGGEPLVEGAFAKCHDLNCAGSTVGAGINKWNRRALLASSSEGGPTREQMVQIIEDTVGWYLDCGLPRSEMLATNGTLGEAVVDALENLHP